MKNRTLGTGLVVLSILALQGCAHGSVSQQLDRKLADIPLVHNRSELKSEANAEIAANSALTTAQRAQLKSLGDSVSHRIDQIVAQSLKLRSVLIKDVISTHYDMDEVNLIRTRLKDLQNQRISLMFDAIDQVNRILGRDALNKDALIHEYLDFDLPRRRS